MRKAGKLWKRSRPPVIDWTDRGDIRRVRKALAERRIFAEPEANSTELVQTHISSVLLTPNFIFKFKRPLNLGFVDLSGLRQRRHYSEAELRLNRRLVRRVYLGVATLREKGGRWQFEPGDRIVDFAVGMRGLERGRNSASDGRGELWPRPKSAFQAIREVGPDPHLVRNTNLPVKICLTG